MVDFASLGRHAKVIVRGREVHGERFYCLGGQVAAVLELLTPSLPPCEWYGSGVRVNGEVPSDLAACRDPSPARIGSGETLRASLASVEQFLSGRLAALAVSPDAADAPPERRQTLAVIEFVHAERMDVATSATDYLTRIAQAFDLRIDILKGEAPRAQNGHSPETDPVAELQRIAAWLSKLLTALGVLSIAVLVVQAIAVLSALRFATMGQATLLLVGILTSLAFVIAVLGLGAFVASTAEAVRSHVLAGGHRSPGDESQGSVASPPSGPGPS